MTGPAPLTRQRCFRHRQREAVARCPGCGHYFCRECTTEHEDQVLCADCIRAAAAGDRAQVTLLDRLVRLFLPVAGFILLWLCFYYLGQVLLLIPSEWHEGTIWYEWLS